MSAATLKARTQAAYDEARLKKVVAAIDELRKARESGTQTASIGHLSIQITSATFKLLEELGYDVEKGEEDVATRIGFAE